MLVAEESEGHKRKPLATPFTEDLEAAAGAQTFGKMICSGGEVGHDLGEAGLAQSDKNIVLSNNMSSAFAKVESEGRL